MATNKGELYARQNNTTVLKIFLILSTIFHVNLYAQDIGGIFNQIKTIPCNYSPKEFPKETAISINVDSAFKYIVNQDNKIIPWLIEQITDTTLTLIKKPGEESYFKKGDLATVLIDHIRFIPLFKITHVQFDICCICGTLPEGFLAYLDNHRAEFQVKFKDYYFAKDKN
jgi:hypothetical protein